jgi:hypothetical protein
LHYPIKDQEYRNENQFLLIFEFILIIITSSNGRRGLGNKIKDFGEFFNENLNIPPMDRAADRLQLFLASGTARVQLGTNMLKYTIDSGRY